MEKTQIDPVSPVEFNNAVFLVLYCLNYKNDLPDAIENLVKLFADDTKVYATVNTEEESNSLQRDIDALMNWLDDWLLKVNKTKCKHLHIGQETGAKYTMNNEIVINRDEQRKRSRNHYR